MRYSHYVLDSKGESIEQFYSERKDIRFSMQCTAKIIKGTYKIWDRETGIVEDVKAI